MTTTTSTTNDNQPHDRVILGPIEATIWQNVGDNNRPFYRVSFSRSYRDSDGAWKKTTSYSRDDLLMLAKVADKAHSRILEIQAEDNQRQRDAEKAVAAEATQGAAR